ncbi:hypothetical protein AGMMS49944_29330 [Spirochaetia bacterium]|nr:hypothetical protein AGMMS49944_29330 [Spirochaetia bacterium]
MKAILEQHLMDRDIDVTVAEDTHKLYIREKLAEAEAYVAGPDAKWYTSEELWTRIEEKFRDVL